MQTARERWAAEYRAFRAFSRFFSTFRPSLSDYPGGYPLTLLALRFDHSRLHGDHLRTFVGHMGQVTHQSRMCHLRRRVRLPA